MLVDETVPNAFMNLVSMRLNVYLLSCKTPARHACVIDVYIHRMLCSYIFRLIPSVSPWLSTTNCTAWIHMAELEVLAVVSILALLVPLRIQRASSAILGALTVIEWLVQFAGRTVHRDIGMMVHFALSQVSEWNTCCDTYVNTQVTYVGHLPTCVWSSLHFLFFLQQCSRIWSWFRIHHLPRRMGKVFEGQSDHRM